MEQCPCIECLTLASCKARLDRTCGNPFHRLKDCSILNSFLYLHYKKEKRGLLNHVHLKRRSDEVARKAKLYEAFGLRKELYEFATYWGDGGPGRKDGK